MPTPRHLLIAALLASFRLTMVAAQAGPLGAGAVARPVVLPSHNETRIVWLPASDSSLDAAAGAALDRVLDFYNYNRHNGVWTVSQLGCDFLPFDRIFKFEQSASDSAFVAILPAQGAPEVVPLGQGAYADPDREQDPHNQAIADGLLAREKFQPKTYGDWMSLALLYLALTGSAAHVVDADHRFSLPVPSAQAAWMPLLIAAPNGGMTVEFYDLRNRLDLISWDFDFDGSGLLLAVGRRDALPPLFPPGRYR